MKLYTPPEMSKKLVQLGCISQSGIYWVEEEKGRWDQLFYGEFEPILDALPAFEFEDFAGPGEDATKNAGLFIEKNGPFNLDFFNDGFEPIEAFKLGLILSKNWVEEVGRGLI